MHRWNVQVGFSGTLMWCTCRILKFNLTWSTCAGGEGRPGRVCGEQSGAISTVVTTCARHRHSSTLTDRH